MPSAGTKKPAFDQEKLAAAISTATGHKYTALTLPFAPLVGGRGGWRARRGRPGASPRHSTFTNGETAIEFGTGRLDV